MNKVLAMRGMTRTTVVGLKLADLLKLTKGETTPLVCTLYLLVESTSVGCATSLPTMAGRMFSTMWRQNISPTLVVMSAMCVAGSTRLPGLCTGITCSIIGSNKINNTG